MAADAGVSALTPAVGADRVRFSASARPRVRATRAGGMDRPTRFAVGAALAAAAAVMATQVLDYGAWNLRVHTLDASREWSWSHVASAIGIACATALCVTGAARAGAETGERRGAWRAAAVLLGVLLADNVTRLHEHVPHWPAVYAPIVAGLAVAVVIAAAGRPGARLVQAAVVLLCASLVIHVAGPAAVRALGWGPASLAFQVKVALKEGSELAGWVLLVAGLARLVPRRGARRRGA